VSIVAKHRSHARQRRRTSLDRFGTFVAAVA
jgi:hypothetical protein